MHSPLNPAIDNWHALREVIKPYNIQAILHGHDHPNRATSYEGIPGVMSPSTSAREHQPSGYTGVELPPNKATLIERIPLAHSTHFWHRLALGEKDARGSLKLHYPDYSGNDISHVNMV